MSNLKRAVPVQYIRCPNKVDPAPHWILFDMDTVVRASVQCTGCGPKAFVLIDTSFLKRGFVDFDEEDAGYTNKEPESAPEHRSA